MITTITKNLDTSSPCNPTLKEKNITGPDRNHSPIMSGIFLSNLHKGGEFKRPCETLPNRNQEIVKFGRSGPEKELPPKIMTN